MHLLPVNNYIGKYINPIFYGRFILLIGMFKFNSKEVLYMGKGHIDKLLYYYQNVFNELYIIETIVKMTKDSCLEREFNGEYYGTSGEYSAQLSAERNSYINMLTILSEKVSILIDMNTSAENELLLQENSNNCSRKIAAECSANKSP